MKRVIGPILFLRQGTAEIWRFSLGIWVEMEAQESLSLSFSPAAGVSHAASPRQAGNVLGKAWLMWDVEIRKTAQDQQFSYAIGGLSEAVEFDHLVVPARGEVPRIAFFSCNGVENPSDWTNQPDMEKLWLKMLERHKAGQKPDGSGGAYHVIVGGGDQVYCDGVWRHGELGKLKSWDDRKKAKVTKKIAREIEEAYAGMYARWRVSYFRELQARVPGVYTWDDHDIFDGWGSYSDDLQDCDLFKKIFAVAREGFMAFQLGDGQPATPSLRLDPSGEHFLQAVRFEDRLDLLLLDLRSARRSGQVMAKNQWKALGQYLESRANGGKAPAHLLIVSTIPVVYLNFAAAEKFLDWFPWRQGLEDDLRDQWESAAHQQERGRLIMTLLNHAKKASTRITVLSGDVHVGARGRIASRRPEHLLDGETQALIHQLTSSAIVFPSPSALMLAGMRAVAQEGPTPVIEVSQVETEVSRVSAKHFLLGQNNWLSIEPDSQWDSSEKKLWVRWITEEGGVEPPVVVHRRNMTT